MYYWKERLRTKDINHYYVIDALNDTVLVLTVPTTGVQTYFYYHAE